MKKIILLLICLFSTSSSLACSMPIGPQPVRLNKNLSGLEDKAVKAQKAVDKIYKSINGIDQKSSLILPSGTQHIIMILEGINLAGDSAVKHSEFFIKFRLYSTKTKNSKTCKIDFKKKLGISYSATCGRDYAYVAAKETCTYASKKL